MGKDAMKLDPEKIIYIALNVQIGPSLTPLPALHQHLIPRGTRTVGTFVRTSADPICRYRIFEDAVREKL
jgi:hypothetical protein